MSAVDEMKFSQFLTVQSRNDDQRSEALSRTGLNEMKKSPNSAMNENFSITQSREIKNFDYNFGSGTFETFPNESKCTNRNDNSDVSDSTMNLPSPSSSFNRTLLKQHHRKMNELTLEWLEHNYVVREGICLPRCLIYRHYLEFMRTFYNESKPVGAAAFGKV